MSQEFFTVTVFLTVSSLAWGQYVEMNRPEPNHCQLRPDRRRCAPTFLPRWYFNPFKGNCYLFQYGGCHGNRNNFMSREECLDKCGQRPPPNAPQPPQSSPPEIPDDTQIEAYVERCKAPADTGPCRARMNKWYYDAGKRRCFPFIYGGCGGNSNKYNSEDECMRKCAISVNNRFASPYLRNGPPNGGPNVRDRALRGRPPLRRSIRNPETRGTFFRTFFPLIWQVSIPKTPEVEPSVPGSPKPEDMEMMKTTGIAMSQEVSTPANVEVTKDTTTQPPKGMMETTGIQASTTPPARLEEEEINHENNNAQGVVSREEDDAEYDDGEPNEEVGVSDMNDREEEEVEMEKENDVEEKSLEGENEEQGWKSSRENIENSEEKEEEENLEYDYNNVEDSSRGNEGIEKPNEDSKEPNEDYDNDEAEREEEEDEPVEDEAEEKNLENDKKDNENDNENEEEEKMSRLNLPRTRGPIIRFLIRSPSRFNRPPYRRIFQPNRPSPVRRLDYRKYYGPRDMSSEERFGNFRRYPKFNRPTPFDFNRQRRIRYRRDRDNRTPKRGISFTQVFVNKPPHPPIVSRHPLLPVPMPMHPYPVSPYHSPAILRYPGVGYSRSFSIQGRQQPGSPPQFTGAYQATRWPANGPATQVQFRFLPRVGEPNLACIQPPAVYRCLFGIPSATPFWYFDARIGKCAVFYFAGCGATLNRFNSRLECENTCMVTSPRPEITPKSEESTEQSTAKSTESLEIVDEKSTEQKIDLSATTAPDIESLFVKETEEKQKGNEEPENTVEGTIELSKTHKVHILHELTDKDNLLGNDKSSDLEYVMVVGIVCLSGVPLLIIVSLGMMYMFKKFQNASSAKAFPKPKRETVIEAVLKAHMQPTSLPKIVCPVPLGPPQNTSL